MPAMQMLRNAVSLSRLVLAWFVLTLGVAVASPMVQPHAMELVCTAGGAIKLVSVEDGRDLSASAAHGLDCPMCLAVTLPPGPAVQPAAQPQPLGRALQPIVSARIAALVGAPLPPRGPPSLLSFA